MQISKKGFTLIEVMLAASILGIGCLGVLGLMITAIQNNTNAHNRTHAVYLAERYTTQFQLESKECNNSAWHQLSDGSDEYNGMKYFVLCKNVTTGQSVRVNEINGGTSQRTPVALRVVWGTDCTEAQAQKLDKFDDTRKSSNCNFITTTFVPFNAN